jgi:hypothetical protein
MPTHTILPSLANMTIFIENTEPTHRPYKPRTLTIATLLASLTATLLLTAACSDTPANKTAGGAQDRHAQAVAYAKCMRENGDPSWPDPGADGAFPNANGNLDRTSDAYKKANDACKDKQPQGAGNAADIETQFQQLLAYSKCMRDHGVTKFPDPVKADGGVGIDTPKDVDANSDTYKKAAETCRTLPGAPRDH